MTISIAQQYNLINEFCKQAPVNVRALSEAMGVPVREALLSKGISGMLERISKDSYQITINETDPPTRKRFTIAHELGHYMLHRFLVGDGVDDSTAYRSTDIGKYHNTNIGKEEETEANKFAANLLMPKQLILEDKAIYKNHTAEERAKRFGVSEQAMSIRMGVKA